MPKPLFHLPTLCLLTASALTASALTATAQPSPAPPRVTVGAPVSRSPFANEIGASLLNGALRGAFVYASNEPFDDAKGRGFLALSSNLTPTGEGQVVIYPLQLSGANVPFDPQCAPDGQSVLFKVGAMGGMYHLFWLDLPTGAVRLAVRALTLRRVLFSPDGRYLAYLAGRTGDETQPLRLLCNEWRSDREKLMVRNEGTFNGFAWRAPHTLLFSALPRAPKAHPGRDHKGEVAVLSGVAQQKLPTVARPNIYQATPQSGEVALAMLEGNRPQPSPDGKWVAFFGLETPTDNSELRPQWQPEPSYVALSVMRAEGLGRMALNGEKQTSRSFSG